MTSDNDLEEYADPTIYDHENTSFEPDGPFYLALARRRVCVQKSSLTPMLENGRTWQAARI